MGKYFVFKTKPISYNSKRLAQYKARLQAEFLSDINNNGIQPITNIDLYANIIYFHQNPTDIDADNLSKPFIDTFTNVIYDDDKLIKHRIASKILQSNFSVIEIDGNMPTNILLKLTDYIGSENHVLFFEIGELKNKMIKVGYGI